MASRAKQVAHDPPQSLDELATKKGAVVTKKKKKVVTSAATGAGSAAPDAATKKKKVVKSITVAPASDDNNIDKDLMDLVPSEDDEEVPVVTETPKKKATKKVGAAKKGKTITTKGGGKVIKVVSKKTVNKEAVNGLFGKHKKALAPGKRELREITKEMKRLRNTAIKPASFENMTRQVLREEHGKKVTSFTLPIRHWHVRLEEMAHVLLNTAGDAYKIGDKKSLWLTHLFLARKALHGKHNIKWTLLDPAQEYRDKLPSNRRNKDITI